MELFCGNKCTGAQTDRKGEKAFENYILLSYEQNYPFVSVKISFDTLAFLNRFGSVCLIRVDFPKL